MEEMEASHNHASSTSKLEEKIETLSIQDGSDDWGVVWGKAKKNSPIASLASSSIASSSTSTTTTTTTTTPHTQPRKPKLVPLNRGSAHASKTSKQSTSTNSTALKMSWAGVVATTAEQYPWDRDDDFEYPNATVAPHVLKLPIDVWIMITSYLHPQRLAALTRVHSQLYNMITPLLYESVHLHTKSFDELVYNQAYFKQSFEYMQAPLSYARCWDLPDDKGRIQKQHKFIRSILAHPELAAHVKRFSWTLGLTEKYLQPWNDPGLDGEPYDVYQVFGMLRNVWKVDISGCMLGSPVLPDHMAGAVFFPSAKCVRLGRTLPQELVEAIMHNTDGPGDTSKPLSFVAFHDFKEFGGVPKGLYRLNKCKGVNTLFIRRYEQEDGPLAQQFVLNGWAQFMIASRAKHVIFDCRRFLSGLPGRGADTGRARSEAVDDLNFKAVLLPVLEKGWPELETVEIRGISYENIRTLEHMETAAAKARRQEHDQWRLRPCGHQ